MAQNRKITMVKLVSAPPLYIVYQFTMTILTMDITLSAKFIEALLMQVQLIV